ncbi:Crp/Fnr family transcriptional regulator [Luedemannella helvata]|uniref:Crp/Fnr family transcriptional regulator n=1 Tax=Luedemannella helvata TaxID=349315 RepID=A0ABP4WGG7_9ACTN
MRDRFEGPNPPSWAPSSLLTQLSVEDAEALLAAGSPRTFARGDWLMLLGEPGTYVVVLTSGCVKVLGGPADGRTTLLAVRAAGDVVGELSVLDGEPRSASVVAASHVRGRLIEARAFRSLLATRPSIGLVVQRVVAAKLRRQIRHRMDVGAQPVAVGLARVIEHLGTEYGQQTPEGTLIAVPLSQPELAALVAAERSSVERALRRLRERGAVSTGYRRVIVTDWAALRAVAAGS